MNHPGAFKTLLDQPAPILALAPMQDVTDLPFLRLINSYRGADLYCTEYFRVLPTSRLDPKILSTITENPTGCPIAAQMIGNDVPSLIRTARELQNYPIAAVDLNLGCPVPVVYRKNAGGGLLRDPERIDKILGALREAITIPFTVKTRIGFEEPGLFEQLLSVYAQHSLDLLTVHGRTVKEMYRTAVHYDLIARAVSVMPCPVLANGNVHSPLRAEEVLRTTGARGVMIGRSAIRNPWIFQQIRDHLQGRPAVYPRGRDVLAYIHALYEATIIADIAEVSQVNKMKKYLNHLGLGVEPTGAFLHGMRRARSKAELFRVATDFLEHDDLLRLEPYPIALKESDQMAGENSGGNCT